MEPQCTKYSECRKQNNVQRLQTWQQRDTLDTTSLLRAEIVHTSAANVWAPNLNHRPGLSPLESIYRKLDLSQRFCLRKRPIEAPWTPRPSSRDKGRAMPKDMSPYVLLYPQRRQKRFERPKTLGNMQGAKNVQGKMPSILVDLCYT